MTPTTFPPEGVTLRIEDAPFGLSREEFAARVAHVVELTADAVALPDGALAQVVVTDEARFGPAIHELQTSAGRPTGYTHNGVHRAVAKTLPGRAGGRGPAGGNPPSTVVLSECVAALAVAFAAGSASGQGLETDAPLFYYVVAHELGHCKDHHVRDVADDVPIRPVGGAIIRPVARTYEHTILSEFAACVHAAPAMPDAAYAAQINDWAQDAENVLRAVDPAWAAYQADPDAPGHLYTLALDAAQAMWVLCVQYAKLAGTAFGDPRHPPPRQAGGALRPAGRPDALLARAALDALDAELRTLWASYPDWPPGCGEGLLRAWHTLACAHGFTFEEGASGDALFLRRPDLPAAT